MNSSDISIISEKMESMSMNHRVVRHCHNKKLQQSRYSPYSKENIISTIEKEMQKDEAIRLGVELSLFVAETMVLLSDNLRSMLLFCLWVLTNAECTYFTDPVVGRLHCVMLYVLETYIKPKNGVYLADVKSNQWEVFVKSCKSFVFGIRELDRIVLILGKRESSSCEVVKTSDFEHCNQELKKLEETLRSAKDVSEANGFAREVIKSNILCLWKSLFETSQPKVINLKNRTLDMFKPLLNQAREITCSSLIASLHI
ncbi:unnamed protein product [Arabidopsis thaliana]|jgi:hypothetical protein|uniref:Uncharacterized protein n=2 Tax=Arabidopsis thaliana TaxID=3702 RepID=Q9LK87_ARATH|nr:hypothetical protein (DUF1184) [Arabidopsis thaliana]NP_001325897.1 hypothetical protein (DUF1184) [Arabidopsis thaliana]ANM63827.1 hypothetical protein (DUF1184) [Arabidopsis thaliana]ANM63828.1 hypothetical protein (DUF1184) [Arabidopsis thaliana]BAB02536.1 unnamed protein product [Arabidopsis thaliana]|eukprot:NP_001325896.1 hypothetical protein (DUF1184) [Arabidopsis thaliana]